MPNGFQTKVLLWHQTWVNSRFQSKDQHITRSGILTLNWTLFDLPCRCFGTVGIDREWASVGESLHQTWPWRHCDHGQPCYWLQQCCHRQHGLSVSVCCTDWCPLETTAFNMPAETFWHVFIRRNIITSSSCLHFPAHRIKVWDLSQQALVTTYNGERTS